MAGFAFLHVLTTPHLHCFLIPHPVTLEQFALAVQKCQVNEDQALLKKVCVKIEKYR